MGEDFDLVIDFSPSLIVSCGVLRVYYALRKIRKIYNTTFGLTMQPNESTVSIRIKRLFHVFGLM